MSVGFLMLLMWFGFRYFDFDREKIAVSKKQWERIYRKTRDY